MEALPTLRARKKARTRQALVEAAWELFREKGFDATTIDDIAEQAEVSRRTFFRYFPTKEAVVFPRNAERLEHFRRLLAEGGEVEPPFQALRHACLEMARAFASSREELLQQHLLIESSRSLVAYEIELDRQWEAVVAEALLRRGEDTELRARFVAGAMTGVVRAVLRHWFAGACRQNLVDMAKEALSTLERGMGRAAEG